MADKIPQLLSKFQGNAWPAMVNDLAGYLGVSVDSLSKLELGWVPVIEFKGGPNTQGWWATPERDETGEPIGLSLRPHRSDHPKPMYPGSKHGLIYPINSQHERGKIGYKHGAHNWIRPHDYGIECPVCEKPDGCLLSAEDPYDPKAVICIREDSGRPMKFGWLHILKKEGLMTGAPVLPTSEKPVLIVEGMTDTAAAMDLGFVAVGRPSNMGGLDMLKEVVRNRDIVVLGENDDLNPKTGKRPGYEGMVATFQTLKHVSASVRMVMPPDHVKDLRSWVQAGLTQDELLSYIDDNSREEDEQKVLQDDDPTTIAYAFLDSKFRLAGRYTLRYWRGQWFEYAGSYYREVEPESEIRGPFYRWARDKYVLTQSTKGDETVKSLKSNRGLVNNILDALLDPCPIMSRDVPAWMNGVDGPDPRDLIVFSNGILWVSKYLEGASEDDYLLELTPDFFTTFARPYPFDPTADYLHFKQFMRSSLADDPAKPKLTQEWFGYCMTPDVSMHKMMLLRGQPRSGKGTLLHALQTVVGKAHVASTSFASLTSQFGLAPLVGTQLAVMGDARLPRKTDNMRALELLLNIVGEDPQQVDRKFKPPLKDHKLRCKFTIATNELPELPDHTGALEARLNILDFNQSFLGREDWDLRDKLAEEAPGIAIWALEGLKRLRENGRFTLPTQSKESIREFRVSTSPTAAFLEECCEFDPSYEIPKRELYDAWTAWSQERGMRMLTVNRFYERLKANSQHVSSDSYIKGGHKFNVFRGVQLQSWAARKLLGRPR